MSDFTHPPGEPRPAHRDAYAKGAAQRVAEYVATHRNFGQMSGLMVARETAHLIASDPAVQRDLGLVAAGALDAQEAEIERLRSLVGRLADDLDSWLKSDPLDETLNPEGWEESAALLAEAREVAT